MGSTTIPSPNPLFGANRSCVACELRSSCLGPVPADGPPTARLMFIGEAPGENEDRSGFPFQGNAGIFLTYLLEMLGINRRDVWITNLLKCRPPGNADPTPDQIASCSPRWLDTEISMVQPDLIVTLGLHSSRYLLGSDIEMNKDHGLPRVINWDGRSVTVLPVYHPSAGLQERSYLRWIFEDFQVLRRLLAGERAEDITPKDEHPNPSYREVQSRDHALELLSLPYFALDTETVPGPDGRSHLWSIQVSNEAGTGWFIPVSLVTDRDVVDGDPLTGLIPPTSTVLVHNYLYDARFIEIPNPIDTMVLAYLLQLPLGLKTLSYRLCGMEMQEYDEYVMPLRREKALNYLNQAAGMEWPKPPQIVDWEWDNKSRQYQDKVRKPHHIKRKIQERIKKTNEDPDYDPYLKWREIDPRERDVVESVLGPMLDASLADIPQSDALYYSARDPDATWRVGQQLWPMIEEKGLTQVAGWLDLPMLPVALEMMLRGMAVDPERLESISDKCKGEMVDLVDKIAEVSNGARINANSPDQVAQLVYGWEKGDKRKSTKDQELKKSKHPAVPHIQKSREFAKIKDSYADKLIPYLKLESDGIYRTHPTIRVTGTETGRFRVADPPLQAIPTRTALGREIRGAFMATPGYKLVSIDYSQIEMRVLAHVSQCLNLLDLFRAGGDMHTVMACRCFEITEEEVLADEPRYRYPIKRLHFGIVYGITAAGLYNGLMEEGVSGWDIPRCQEFIDLYFNMNPEIRDYTLEYQRHARRDGYVRDPLFGRIRHIPEILVPFQYIEAEGERQASNMPIAAAAQGILKLATAWIRQYREQLEPERRFWFLMQVHDELIFEIPESSALETAKEIANLMVAAGEYLNLDVPLVADIEIGDRWGEMEKVKS